MGEKFKFLDAGLDEIIYRIPAPTKLISSANKFNSKDGIPGNGTVMVYTTKSGVTPLVQELLNNLITAIKLDPKETVQIEIGITENINFQEIIKIYLTDYLIVFGLSPVEIGLHVETPKYSFFKIGETSILFADHIESLAIDAKKKLWNELRNKYNLV